MCQCNASLPESCFIFVHATPGDRVGLVTRGKSGFLITSIDQKDLTDHEVNVLVNSLNSARGINPHTAHRMLDIAINGGVPASNEERMAA